MKESSLEKFGKFITQNLFDKGIHQFIELSKNQIKASSKLKLQADLQNFSPEQIDVIQKLVISILVTSTHDYLFALEERNDFEEDIKIIVDGKNLVEESDGLHGELFLEDGWLQKFSQFSTLLED